MGLDDLTKTLNNVSDVIENVDNAMYAASELQPTVEVLSKASLPRKLSGSNAIPTAEKLRQAIFALLTGQSNNILTFNGKPIPSMQCNDPLQNENLYDNTYSIGKHLSNKEKITEFKTEGIETKLNKLNDPITDLPKYNSTTIQQEDVKVIYNPDGTISSEEIETKNSQKVIPTNYTADSYLQSIINSIVVTISNSVAEAVTKVVMSKIEENQTTIEIEWDPLMQHQISLMNIPQTFYNAAGSVSPASVNVMGVLNATQNGTISFKNGIRYRHKCRINFGRDALI